MWENSARDLKIWESARDPLVRVSTEKTSKEQRKSQRIRALKKRNRGPSAFGDASARSHPGLWAPRKQAQTQRPAASPKRGRAGRKSSHMIIKDIEIGHFINTTFQNIVMRFLQRFSNFPLGSLNYANLDTIDNLQFSKILETSEEKKEKIC